MTTERRIKSKQEERRFLDSPSWEDVLDWAEERQFLETLYWAGVLIWAGLVFLANSLELLPQVGEADAWTWVFLGVGLYGTLGNLFRLASPKYSNPTAWDYVWSGFWLLVGLSVLIAADIFWPLVLLLVGVAILGHTVLRRD